MNVKQRRRTFRIIFLISIVLVITGVLAKWVLGPIAIQAIVYKNMEITEGTMAYDTWYEPPQNLVFSKYYIWNVENPDEIKEGEKPRLTQYGPYVYREHRIKEDIARIGYDKIFYGQHMEYIFDEKETQNSGCVNGKNEPCKKTDLVTVINVPLIAAIDLIKSLPPIPLHYKPFTTLPSALLKLLDFFLFDRNGCKIHGEHMPPLCDDLFYTAPVDDLLWQGHNPGIINLGFVVLEVFENIFKKLGINIDLYKFLPIQLSGGTLGFYKGKNDTKLNNYRLINNGNLIHDKYLNIEELNGNSDLPDNWWPNVAPTPSGKDSGLKGICHTLQGTDATFFHQFLSRENPVWFYVEELCRSVYAEFDTETKVRGIATWRYRASRDLLDYDVNKNLCFCPGFETCLRRKEGKDEWDKSNCTDQEICQNGLLHAKGCYGGVPVVLSQPHFFLCDESLANAIDGMKPNEDDHDSYLDIEPLSGVTMVGHKRGQINIHIRPTEGIRVLENVRSLYFPLMWADEMATIDEESANLYKSKATIPLLLLDIFSLGFGLALGGSGIIVCVIFFIYDNHFSRKSKTNNEKIK